MDPVMESFIVLVYRRDGQGSEAVLAGLVERTSDGSRWPFGSVEELCAVLAAPAGGSGARTRGPQTRSDR